MDFDLGVMAFDAKETRQWRQGLGEASNVAVTWRRRGQGLDVIDLSTELLLYNPWRLK